MRTYRTLMACSAVLTLLVACPKEQGSEKPEAKTEPAKVEPAKPTATTTAAAAGPAGGRKMANCPSTVEGASTAIDDAPDAVVVTVTGTGEATIKEIRERAQHLVEVSAKAPSEVKHTGEGEGGGVLGNCPIVLADTTIVSQDVENGAKVTVKPSKAEDLPKLKALARERQAKMAVPK